MVQTNKFARQPVAIIFAVSVNNSESCWCIFAPLIYNGLIIRFPTLSYVKMQDDVKNTKKFNSLPHIRVLFKFNMPISHQCINIDYIDVRLTYG